MFFMLTTKFIIHNLFLSLNVIVFRFLLTVCDKSCILFANGYSYPEKAEGQARGSPATITSENTVNGANLQGMNMSWR